MGRALGRILFVCLILAGFAGSAEARRVALVIGNSAYEHASPLANPKNDANALAAALKRLDFEVVKGVDLKRSDFEKSVRDFARAIRGADTALLFYAGHGLQVGGRNYLAPVDARLSDEADLDFETLPLTTILKQMEREVKTSLVFLDACRDNPLARNLARSMGTRSASVGRGLARVDSGIGTLIAFATEPGNVALDGSGGNSPFTQALLKHIETPGLDIAQMMRRVRSDVMRSTAQRQVPWNNSSLTGDFYFAGKVTVTSGNAPQDDKRFSELQDELKKLRQELKNKPAPEQKPKDDAKLSALQKELADLREELKKKPAAKPEPRDDKKMEAMQKELAKLREELTKRPVVQPQPRNNEKVSSLQKEVAALRKRLEGKDQSDGNDLKPEPTFKNKSNQTTSADAQTNLVMAYAAEQSSNFEDSLSLFRNAAEAGNAEAMMALGFKYSTGTGVRKDVREGLKWTRKAVENGNIHAMHNLAVMYEHGTGVRKNVGEAFRLYKKAAEAGDTDAMGNLGSAYEAGRGTRRNSIAAANWIFKSIEQKNENTARGLIKYSNLLSATFNRELQRLLQQKGVYSGPIDGSFGPGTRRAIEALASR